MIISETSKYIVNVNNIRHFFRSFAIISYFCKDERDNGYRFCRAEGLFLPPADACTLHGAGLLRHGATARPTSACAPTTSSAVPTATWARHRRLWNATRVPLHPQTLPLLDATSNS